jgi:hypothetical protein
VKEGRASARGMETLDRSRVTDEDAGAALDRLLRLAGLRKSDRVALVGGTVDGLIGLYRRGYRQVTLLNRPTRGMDAVDAVVLDGLGTVAEITERLTRFRPLLARAAILVVRQDHCEGAQPARALWQRLAGSGFTPVLQVGAGAGFVMLARRADAGRRAQAA